MNTALAAIATAAALAFSAPALAATVNEGDLPGGSFSGTWNAPTVFGPSVTGVTGTGSANAFDFFVLTLPTGAQTVTFSFAAPAVVDYSFAAGGAIRWSETPFPWQWGGNATLPDFHLGYGQTTTARSLELGPAFQGALHVGLYFTYGSGITYSVTSDAAQPQAAPGVVPLPGAGLLLLTGLAGAAAIARRRRA